MRNFQTPGRNDSVGKFNKDQKLPTPASPKLRLIIFASALTVLLNSCTPAAPRGKGTLEVKIKDHRAAIDDFAKLDVPIEAIRVKPSSSWIDAKPDVPAIDLTAYRKGNSITVYKSELEAGGFEGFHLKLGEIVGVLKKNQSRVETKNSVGPIQLSFSVDPGKVTLLVIDLKVLDLSDHAGRGYELHINGYEHFRDGKLIDRVPPA
jgi:hypothetical protein